MTNENTPDETAAQPAAGPDAPVQPELVADEQASPAPVHESARTPLRDRVLGIRGIVAVALAGLVLGGLGGAALGAVAAGDDDRDGHRGEPGRHAFPQGQFQPGGPGVLPPGAGPQDDTDDAQPDDTDPSGDPT